MSDTKTCNLTEDEIKALIASHAHRLLSESNTDDTQKEIDNHLERMHYLNKRLKAFKEVEEKSPLAKAVEATPDTQTVAEATGWPTNG